MSPSSSVSLAWGTASAVKVVVGTASLVLVAEAWKLPWYLDCRHSREWSEFRYALATSGTGFQEGIFWFAHEILEKTEPIFLRIQNTKHVYGLCDDSSGNLSEHAVPTRQQDQESVFNQEGGTADWTDADRERRSNFFEDFCYFGYVAAATYRANSIDTKVRGVEEGRTHVLTLLRTLMMSKSNTIDFWDSSGWSDDFDELLRLAWPLADPAISGATVGEVVGDRTARIDDTWRPWDMLRDGLEATLWSVPLRSSTAHSAVIAPLVKSVPRAEAFADHVHDASWRRVTLRIAALGFHTSLVLELVAVWTELLADAIELKLAAHVLEPSASTVAEVRRKSLCREFMDGDLCAWDARLLALNDRHVRRAVLPLAGLPSPMIDDVPGFLEDFVSAFQTVSGEVSDTFDTRIDHAELFLCTEPVLLCGAIARAFPGRPIIGYFANPLMSYVPAEHGQVWLTLFRELVVGNVHAGGEKESMHASAPLLPVANTRFLAEQMRFQTGVRVLTARPLALYLGPARGTPRPDEVIVVRAQSVFWNSVCVLNSILILNQEDLRWHRHVGGGVGFQPANLRFVPSEDLADGSSEALASFGAAVIYPYDVSQMRLYELYALSVPIFLPARRALPAYLYRGMTTMEDFDHVLSGVARPGPAWSQPLPSQIGARPAEDGDGMHSTLPPAPTFLEKNPFQREDWHVVSAWAELTHWMSLPYLLHCSGVSHMLLRMTNEDLRPVVAGMRRQQLRDASRAAHFWSGAFSALQRHNFRSRGPLEENVK
eukprot:TRINITY_DN77491_c0_g1_i1.p1 TRINITY_DN77491_c0_g1~~TRINITY_DN77491_c0_g1_i1.p1  ORF type:complete len:770 (-),score=101.44 TRINITY_DN77491_c0_g1_i1:4-2313(-)